MIKMIDALSLAAAWALHWLFFLAALILAVFISLAPFSRWHLFMCILSGLLVGFTFSEARRRK